MSGGGAVVCVGQGGVADTFVIDTGSGIKHRGWD